MRKSEIRPFSIYIGNGGVMKKVKSISMAIDGSLYVEWRLVKTTRRSLEVKESIEPIERFAKWAKAIKETISHDLRHHLPY
jgi:hypothetical protein